MKSILTLIIFVLGFFYAGAQKWSVYNTSNSNVPSDTILPVFFEADGTKWFRVSDGAASLIGGFWTLYDTVFLKAATSVTADSKDNLWIGTKGSGLIKFDGISYTVYNTTNSNLPHNKVWDVVWDEENYKLWMGTDQGVATFDGISQWKVYNTSNSNIQGNYIPSIAMGKNANVWAGVSDSPRVSMYNDSLGKWANFAIPYDPGFTGLYVRDIEIGTNGDKWFASFGAVKYDGSRWTFYHSGNSQIPGGAIFDITLDKNNGNVWVSAPGSGIGKFNNNTWTVYDQSNSGLPDDNTLSVRIGQNGGIWIGTLGSGLAVFDPGGQTGGSSHISGKVTASGDPVDLAVIKI